MAFLSIFGIILCSLCTVLGSTVLALFITLFIFLKGAGLDINNGSMAVIFIMVAALPISGLLAVVLLRQAFLGRSNTVNTSQLVSFEVLIFALIGYLAFNTKGVLALYGASAYISGALDFETQLKFVLLIFERVLFVAAVSALVPVLLVTLTELVVAALATTLRMKTPIVLPSLSQIVVILFISVSFDLYLGFFERELAPLTLLKLIS